MELKDLNIAVEQLDDVRGGQYIGVSQAAQQTGLNTAVSQASGWGVGNVTNSSTSQVAPQSLSQGVGINAAELHSYTRTIDSSVVGFGFGFPRMLAE